MINDIIATASNWEDKLCPLNETRKKTHRFGPHLYLICLLYHKKKKVKPEGSDYLQKTYHSWTIS